MKNINKTALWLLAVGGLNWLLVALLNYDLVTTIATAIPVNGLETLIKGLVGAAGVWIGVLAFQGKVSIR